MPPPPDCADFGADADACVGAEVSELFEPETPPSSQDARVAARPMALTAARTRFEVVIMIGPPMLSIRPLRPEEYRNSMQNSSFEKWGDSHGDNSCSTRGTHGEPEGIRVLPMERW